MSLRTQTIHRRRWWRKPLHTTEDLVQQSGEQFDKNFLERIYHLQLVWRFVLGWLLLFVLIGGGLLAQMNWLRALYQVQVPVPGGMYSEGMLGTFTTANPLFAVNDADTSVAKLVFAGLLTYDTDNHLTGDLADRWTTDSTGTKYTVHLRSGLTWQDGKPLTAADVVFTYQMIQNPDVGSPLQQDWKGVQVAALDSHTVVFTLPNPLSSFPDSLTTGIVPKHLLGTVDPSELRSLDFNTHPIGAGPFAWGSIGISGIGNTAQGQITLVPFQHYWAGTPKLSSFTLHTYATQNALLNAYRNEEITAFSGLTNIPSDITKDKSSHIYDIPLTAGAYVFFKSSNPILNDVKVRQALVAAANRGAIIRSLGFPALPVDEPLLHNQLAYDPTYAQITNQPAQAKALLAADGWNMDSKGVREKNGQQLSFALSVMDGSEYVSVAHQLVDEWKAIGVDAQVDAEQPASFQGTLAGHTYDALLYGISIGVDPDVFVYWNSSQADIRSQNRLNFSEYKSSTADTALDAGRTRSNTQLRIIKYRSFLQAWQQDAPALGLYQPRLLYVSHIPVYGLNNVAINTDAGRLDNAQNWMVHLAWVTR